MKLARLPSWSAPGVKLLVYKISLKLPTKTILSTGTAGEGAAASWVV